jgi:hypothetical protein
MAPAVWLPVAALAASCAAAQLAALALLARQPW